MKAEDNSVKRFSQNDEQIQSWQMSRKEILSMSNIIIPGYGLPFNVTNDVTSNDLSTTIEPIELKN